MARVYRFKDSDGNIIRVGYTKNDDLRKRISSYRSGSQVEIDAIKNCKIIESVHFDDSEKAFDFEGFLIDIINPKYNPKHHKFSFDQSFLKSIKVGLYIQMVYFLIIVV